MNRPFRWVRAWWSRRTIQFRTSVVATAVALVGLGVIARISAGFIAWFLLDSVDTELRVTASTAASRLATGAPPASLSRGGIRVLDTAGQPMDGLPATTLHPWELNELKSGKGVLDVPRFPFEQSSSRWAGQVVPAPQGEPRLVLAEAGLVGYADTLSVVNRLLWLGSGLAAGTVGLATWIVVRRSLRPVERMRIAAGSLPAGERLPVPEAEDELRSLAEALNTMLARRDADTDWLRRFTGDAAHELRNPVASIRAQAEVAVVHPDPDLAQETLQDIATEAQRLSSMVDGMLELARAESGAQPTAGPVELGEAVRAVADRFNMRGVTPRVRVVAPTGAVVIWANSAEVATVADNLVVNALRHARALVRLSLLPAAGSVRLVVDDDGPGIPAEHRDRVFHRFHRVECDRARSTGGSGLGLALVAEAVQRRGGSVRAGESPEGGARIEVRWPLPGPLPASR
jgi:signal transduction histidine kinase